MREKEMQELMQQDIAVPKRIHDSFEKGLEQIYHMDTEQGMVDSMEVGIEEQQAGGRKAEVFWRKTGTFWRKASVVAAAAAVLCILDASPQIYSFARGLFMHDKVTVAGKDVQEANMDLVEINDGALPAAYPEHNYFESLEDLGEKLGVSFLKSPMENKVTGNGRVMARKYEYGDVEISDMIFSCKDISEIEYDGDGGCSWHMDTNENYVISCNISFHTKKFQDELYALGYSTEDGWALVEEYETAGGFHASIVGPADRSADDMLYEDLRAVICYNNMWYEYDADGCRLGDFKLFLDSLTA